MGGAAVVSTWTGVGGSSENRFCSSLVWGGYSQFDLHGSAADLGQAFFNDLQETLLDFFLGEFIGYVQYQGIVRKIPGRVGFSQIFQLLPSLLAATAFRTSAQIWAIDFVVISDPSFILKVCTIISRNRVRLWKTCGQCG